MNTLAEVTALYQTHFNNLIFPSGPPLLYDSIRYFLNGGGKRIRPVLCLLGNQLFNEIHEDAFHACHAIELFHNYSLTHDDIMDSSPLRRNRPTLHVKYNTSTAILAGDVLLIHAFTQINHLRELYKQPIAALFTTTAQQICEGQQMDVNFEATDLAAISYADYLQMITYKTAVLLAASVRIGAIIGGATPQQQADSYDFGKNLGIAFQIQDDYLDAFGDPAQTGKQPGGDILENKKTALLIKTMELSNTSQQADLRAAMQQDGAEKIAAVLQLYKACGADKWAMQTIGEYTAAARNYLDQISVPPHRKSALTELSNQLLERKQ
ncbi:polyprenyl synthetase family protein [Chitinophaga nivalis]|uniref:Polyprenyl synthetase family protein n=1 Tax=Chitinophaga nivalis TaxID=2991709 RepID=A0ABT3IKM0_9BACT|nr:polyprenyl synthetase family protein [Chitinophaga nivalis]MCW3465813.1 polyprenyl synthetase family protein [Chitinophaga nivalis]MCW3484496.1 polyprenyl synthetase family protein [Chitinophaga nivalis]